MQPGEYEQMLHDAEVRLARLKALYEQFFQGIEKLEPTVPRKELDRLMDILRKQQPRNTALRFRTQMLIAKYGTYQTYWQRIARQIEEGTFRRDVVRAQQRRARDQARARSERTAGSDEAREAPSAWELDVDVELEEPETRSVSFDDSDVDAILGSLGAASEPAPAPRRALSPFAIGGSARGASVAPRAAGPASGAAPPPSAAKEQAPASAGRAITTFGKPATATFARPAASPPAPGSATSSPAAAPPARPAAPPARPPAPPSGARPVPPPPPAHVAPPPPPRPPPPAAPDDARLRKIYESYVDARRRNNERVDNVRFETVAQSVQQMIPKLREKHGNRPIDFEVVVQNGKVGLKPKLGG